jgi:hypothetical protein
MALIKAQKALHALAEDVALATADKLAAFLGTKIEIDDDLKELFEEFKTSLKEEYKATAKTATAAARKGKNADGSEKKKRAPTAFNLFVKDEISRLKQENPAMTGKELMSAATAAWKKRKVEE